MRGTALLAIGAVVASVMLTSGAASAQQPARPVTASVTAVQPDGTLKLSLAGPNADRALPVDGAKADVVSIRAGDVVSVELDHVDNPQRITRIVQVRRAVGAFERLIALGIAFAVMLLAAMTATGGDVRKLLVGQDNRYSNSKAQLVFWFGAVMLIYLAAVMLRVAVWGWDSLGGVGLTSNLLALTGLSALTMGGAKAITTVKLNNALQEAPAKTAAAAATAAKASDAAVAASAAPNPTAAAAHSAVAKAAADAATAIAADASAATAPKSGGTPNFTLDLFQNDKGQVDVGDFQMVFVTVLAVIIFLLAGFHYLGAIPREVTTLPDVDTTLLSSFGLGQGAYIIKKMASKPGEG